MPEPLNESEAVRRAQAAAMMASMDGVAILDGEGRYRTVNQAHADVYGCSTPGDMVGRSWRTVYDARELERMEGEVMPLLVRDGHWRGEATGRRADGSTFPQELSLSLLPEGGLVCVVRDLTDRKRAERELRAGEERFRMVVEALGEGIVINGPDDRVLYANSRCASMLGMTVEQMLGTRPCDFTFDEDAAQLQAVWAQRTTGVGSTYEIRQRRADGTEIWVRVNGAPFLGADGEFAGTVAVMTDITERRETEEALRRQAELIDRQREYLRAIIDASPSLIFAKDRDGRFTMANRGLAEVYGTTPDGLVGRTDADFSPDLEAVEGYLAADREVIDTGRSLVIREETVTNPVTGEVRWLHTRKVRLLPPDGGPAQVLGLCVDFTERKRAQDALQASQRQLEEAQRLARLGSWDYDYATNRAGYSEEAYRILGLDPSTAVTYEAFMAMVHPEDRPGLERAQAAAAERLGPTEVEFRVVLPDGTVRYTSSSLGCELDDAGRPLRMFGYLQDVTGRKEVELELRRSQQMLAQTQRMARLGSYTVDLATGQATWSEENYRIFEREPGTPAPTSAEFVAMAHPEDRQWLVDNAAAAVATGEQREGEFRVILPSGGVRYLSSSNQVEYDAAGTPVRMFGHTQDVTERKLAELELRQARDAAETASRAKSEFLSSMSHELRTPLNSVIGFANVLRKNRGGNLGEQELKYLERIHANGRHLLGLINDVLDLSKIEAGKMELELRPVALGELIAETLAELAGAARDKEVELLAVVPEGMAPLETDPFKLKQVLINLLGNAAKFTERGRVTVAVIPDPATGRPLRLEVRDTGVGIPAERLAAIFQAFEQAESGIARRFGGTGLGLTISRSLCELMGYRMEVQSEEGVGSTFAVVLGEGVQAAGGAELAGELRAEPAAAGDDTWGGDFRRRTVLIIDDETDARTLLMHNLDELGCQSIGASSGPQGLRMAREFRPDLITLDLLMPGMSGWEILRALKADPELQAIPVVIVSVMAAEARASLLGAVDLLEKPFEVELLRRVLDRHLSRESGRVLVVQPDLQAQPRLACCLAAEGVETRSATSGSEALRLLDEAPADLLVVDIPAHAGAALDLLRLLRSRPEHRDVPLVIVTPPHLSGPEQGELGREADEVLVRDESLDARLVETIRRAWRRHPPAGPPSRAAAARPPS